MKGKEILEYLKNNYTGLDTLRYNKRYEGLNVDNKKKNIHWLMFNFSCSYGVALRLVNYANNFSDDYIYNRYKVI